jgi:L-fuculose-phosphate aldolase
MLDPHVKREWYNGIPHTQLMSRFMKAAGVDVERLKRNHISDATDGPGHRWANYCVNAYKEHNGCEGLALLGFAIEQTVSHLYKWVWQGIKKSEMNPRDSAFFPLHILIDDGHGDLFVAAFIENVMERPQECRDAARLVKDMLDTRYAYYDDVWALTLTGRDPYLDRPATPPPAATKQSVHKELSEVSKTAAIKQARMKYQMAHTKYSLSKKIAYAARIASQHGHGGSLAGQVSCKVQLGMEDGLRTLAYGYTFEEAREDLAITVGMDLSNLDDIHKEESKLFANYAIRFHKHVYEAREDIKCIIHSHAPALSTLASTNTPLSIHHMDHTALYGDTRIASSWPGVPFGDEEGQFMVQGLGEKGQVLLLPGHGVLVVGRSIEEVTYRAVWAEDAAKMQIRAMQMGKPLQVLDEELAKQAHDWRLNGGGAENHFHFWIRQLEKKDCYSV